MHVCAGFWSLELDLQVVGSHPTWVLANTLMSLEEKQEFLSTESFLQSPLLFLPHLMLT